MRLIDADALGIGRCSKDVLPAVYCAGWNGMLNIINDTPTIDNVPVVRCRECQWYNAGANNSESWSDCTLRYGKHFNVGPDDFCSYGQRKIETVFSKSDAKDESLEADHD